MARTSGDDTRRAEAQRFASNLSMVLIAVGVVVGLVIVANRWSDRESLQHVRIVGRVVLDSAEIVRLADIPEGVPMASLDLEAIERGVLSHPYITRAAAYRGARGTLVLEIVERTPVGITFLDKSPFYLDSQAVLLPYRFSAATFDVPVITGATHDGTLDSARAYGALQIAQATRAYDDVLYRSISEIRCEANGEYTMILADGGTPVRIGAGESVEPRLHKLAAFLRAMHADRVDADLAYIDLRWRGQVVAKWNS